MSDTNLAFADGRKHITVRFACIGSSGAQLTDETGGLILGVSGCDGSASYSTEYTSAGSNRSVTVAVAPDDSWVIAIWVS